MFTEGAPGFPDKQGPWFLEKLPDDGYLSVLLSGTLLLNAAVSSSVCYGSSKVSCCRLGHISVPLKGHFQNYFSKISVIMTLRVGGGKGHDANFSMNFIGLELVSTHSYSRSCLQVQV